MTPSAGSWWAEAQEWRRHYFDAVEGELEPRASVYAGPLETAVDPARNPQASMGPPPVSAAFTFESPPWLFVYGVSAGGTPLIDEGARMTGEQTFKPLEACAAIRLPRGTLQTWSARGWLRQFDAASVRAGQTYGFSLADVLALALIKEAVGRGINTPVLFDKAHFYADSFLWFPGRVRECVLRFYGEPGDEGSTAAVGTDQVSEREPHPPGVRTTVHFNLEAIFGPVLTALAPAEGGDALVVLRLGARS